ncbi:MATE family efflux transporter [Lachnospiraceae bacterium HCP1S3_A8]|nr:MATE family efflux transporter [Lachnospiraceae bacterium]
MKNDYLITENPLKALIVFAIPMIIGNLFQQAYTMADSAIVGRLVGEKALAAVGAAYSLTNIFICVAIGGGMGASVIVSQYFGHGNYGKLKKTVYTALVTFLVISVMLGVIGLAFSKNIMIAMNTPVEVLDMSVTYLQIYFLGLPFLFMYNVLSSMFNALGKSRIPLYFLIFSSVFNIVLDWVFVADFALDVAGVAWATLIAQGVSVLGSFTVLRKELKKLEGASDGIFEAEELLPMAKIALPSILQQSTVSIGMMLVQSVVNSFGAESLAGFSAGMRIESICIVPMAAVGNAISSYTAQNIGAGQLKRVSKGYVQANKMVIFFGVVICVILELFPTQFITLFLGADGSQVAIATGYGYLVFMGFFFFMIGFKMAADGVLRGAGDMKLFTIANLVNLSIRVIMAMTLAPRFGIAWVWYAVPIGWTANFVISYLEYRTGKWKTIRR